MTCIVGMIHKGKVFIGADSFMVSVQRPFVVLSK